MQTIKQSESTAGRRTVYFTAQNTADDSAYTSTLSGADIQVSKAGSPADIHSAAVRGVLRAGLQILGNAQEFTPIDTGALAASATWSGSEGIGSGSNPGNVPVRAKA